MYKKIVFFILCILIIYLTILYYTFGCFSPGVLVEKAAKFPEYNNYIICSQTRETDYNWEMYNSNFEFLECINVKNDEMIREKYNYDFFCAGNYYYMYGHFGKDNEFGKVFVLEDYDIVFPVKHGIYSLFPVSHNFTYEIETR